MSDATAYLNDGLEPAFAASADGSEDLAVAQLRACLYECQRIEGRPPLECQNRCRHLTPGETGSTSLWQNFWTDFTLPEPAIEGAREIRRTVQYAAIAIVGLLLWRFARA